MTARKKPSGLLALGDPGDPALPSVSDRAAEPVPVTPPQNLETARLLESLPPLVGDDPEKVAMATLLRARCLGEVLSLTLWSWERATPEDREAGEVERLLKAKWLEVLKPLLAPRSADWWLVHGRGGYGAAVHSSLATAFSPGVKAGA